jgi:cellulose synthase/poly-beta-1,6-N-acetylglucosamine synthase-like glycosyltransferase
LEGTDLGVDLIGIIFTMLSVTITLIYSYYVYFGIIGFWKRKPSPDVPPKKSIAIMVPAYREEKVIGGTVKNLLALDYPKDLYDVYVVIDTPDDPTGAAAEKEGAKVLVRNNPRELGKGYTVQWGLKEIRRRKDYDAYMVMDADNLLSANYLAVMNNELTAGNGVIQGQISSKNPKASWVTKTIHADYVTRNRFIKLPRQGKNLCVFMEPAICISREVLDKVPFDAVTISEDLEYSTMLAYAGIRIKWIKEASIYEEKPTSLKIAIKQRRKWMLGHTIVMKKLTGRLLWRAFRNGNTIAWDCATYLLTPALTLVYFLGLVAYLLSGSNFTLLALLPRGYIDPTWIWISTVVNTLVGFWWIVVPLYALYLEKERIREYWYTPFTIMIMFGIQLLLFVAVLFARDRKTYWHTPHGASSTRKRAENAPAADPPISQESSK